jgi:tetratricopeptide (TPR) repeat protein
LIDAIAAGRRRVLGPAAVLVLALVAIERIDLGGSFRTDFAQPLLNAARYYQFAEKPEQALQALRLAEEQLGPDSSRRAEVLEIRGACLVDQGRYAEGIEALEAACRQDPGLIGAYAHLARAYDALGDTSQAEHALEAGLRKAPWDPQLLDLQKRLLGEAVPGEAP